MRTGASATLMRRWWSEILCWGNYAVHFGRNLLTFRANSWLRRQGRRLSRPRKIILDSGR